MPVYAIIEIKIIDPEMYAGYCRAVPAVIAKYGGRYLANTSEVTPITGDWQADKIVLLEFDSMENLRQCFSAKEYRAIAHLRDRSTVGRAIVVSGRQSATTRAEESG